MNKPTLTEDEKSAGSQGAGETMPVTEPARRPARLNMKVKEIKSETAWAWAIRTSPNRWQLCRWAMPSKTQLLELGEKPSPDAVIVRVRMTVTGLSRKAP